MCLSLLRDWEYHSMMIFNHIVQQSHWQKFECLVGPSLFLLWWEHLTRFVGKNKEGILFMPSQKQTKSLITGNFPFSKILLFCLFHYHNMKVIFYQSFHFLFHKQKHHFILVMCYNGKSIVRKKIANMIKWVLREIWQRWSVFCFQLACTENEAHNGLELESAPNRGF